MKLEWMGDYRPVIEAMIGMCNAYSQVVNLEVFRDGTVSVSPAELQVMEYILENEERHENMSQIARRLCISQSSFSKMVKHLAGKGLLEKYRTANNSKNIIIQVSPSGRAFYEAYSSGEMTDVWRRIFRRMEGLDAETVQIFIDSLNEFTRDVQRGIENVSHPEQGKSELIKIE